MYTIEEMLYILLCLCSISHLDQFKLVDADSGRELSDLEATVESVGLTGSWTVNEDFQGWRPTRISQVRGTIPEFNVFDANTLNPENEEQSISNAILEQRIKSEQSDDSVTVRFSLIGGTEETVKINGSCTAKELYAHCKALRISPRFFRSVFSSQASSDCFNRVSGVDHFKLILTGSPSKMLNDLNEELNFDEE